MIAVWIQSNKDQDSSDISKAEYNCLSFIHKVSWLGFEERIV